MNNRLITINSKDNNRVGSKFLPIQCRGCTPPLSLSQSVSFLFYFILINLNYIYCTYISGSDEWRQEGASAHIHPVPLVPVYT